MRGVAVGLALVCILAGCSAVTGGPGGAATETLSPAPLPAEPTATEQLAPGLTGAGVVEPLALVNAHRATLGRSYRLRADWSVRYANGTLYAHVGQTGRVAPGSFRVRVAATGQPGFLTTGPPVETVLWSNGSLLVERYRRGSTVGYRSIGPPVYRSGNDFYESFRQPQPFRDRFALLGAVETRVVERRTGGDRAEYTVVGDRLRSPARFAAATGVRNPEKVSLWMIVDERGLIRSFRLSYAGRLPSGERIHVSRRVSYSEVGAIDRVPRPAWYDRAMRANGSDARDEPAATATPVPTPTPAPTHTS